MGKKNTPDLTLNMNDKVYLAVAKNFTDTFAYVYTLACAQARFKNEYDMIATPQIHAFRNKFAAHIFHDTIEQMVMMNEGDARYTPLFESNKDLLDRFVHQMESHTR